jgi:hypothetical protein
MSNMSSIGVLPRKWVAAVAVVVALGAALTPGGTAAAGGSAAPTVGGADPTATSRDTLALVQRLRDLTERAPDQYGGVSTQGADHVTIHLARNGAQPGVAVSEVMTAASRAGLHVSIDRRTYSLAQLTTIQDAIPGTEPFASLGAGLVLWGVDPESNTVRVGVTKVTPELSAKVRATFGGAVSLVEQAPFRATYGRLTDTPWFYGGDRITSGLGACTSAFTITNLYGTQYALTAGHCFGVGATVKTNGQTFGTVKFRRFGNGNYDNELIGGGDGYAGRIWVGPVNTSTSYPVHQAANSCTGCKVYFDGSVTGQALATLVGAPGCGNIEGQVLCGLQRADGSGTVCQEGDSGGPVFAWDGNGGVTAVGIITAVSTDSTSVCVYTQLPPILAYWQATITTS